MNLMMIPWIEKSWCRFISCSSPQNPYAMKWLSFTNDPSYAHTQKKRSLLCLMLAIWVRLCLIVWCMINEKARVCFPRFGWLIIFIPLLTWTNMLHAIWYWRLLQIEEAGLITENMKLTRHMKRWLELQRHLNPATW